jgi:aspartyl-tRNA(Asn)/glutamyl-tRNA(Gln) amidotransferase subunit C
MTGSPIDIDRLAALARIEIDARESAVVQQKLGAILGLVEALQAVDTSGVVPMAHAHDVAAPLREDRVTEADQHAAFQAVAPSVEGGLYLVPRVIE